MSTWKWGGNDGRLKNWKCLKIGNLDGGWRGKVLAMSKYFSLLLLAVFAKLKWERESSLTFVSLLLNIRIINKFVGRRIECDEEEMAITLPRRLDFEDGGATKKSSDKKHRKKSSFCSQSVENNRKIQQIHHFNCEHLSIPICYHNKSSAISEETD